jgi:DNA-binding FadR family transcriptional regulator
VRQHLIEHIHANQLKSGEIVPSEVKVSADLGVSRGIVREAFRALKAAGIIEISNGRSPRVGRISDEGIGQVLQHAISTEQVTVAQVLDLRAAVEIRAAELAAIHRSPDHVDTLFGMAKNMRSSGDAARRFIESDARFHEVIAIATGNPLFTLIWSAINESLKASIREGLKNRRRLNQVDRIVSTHDRIAAAIAAQDAPRARRYMTIHFEEARVSVGLAGGG